MNGWTLRCTLRSITLLFLPFLLHAQDSRFNLQLAMDSQSAERTIELYRGLGSPTQISSLRGSQLALATTAALSRRPLTAATLEEQLQAVKFGQTTGDDVFQLKGAHATAAEMDELLREMKTRNFSRRVVSTVEQLFPAGTSIAVSVPMYVVAFGHQNIDAYVNRVVWRGNTPSFVGEGAGQVTIVLNLAKAVHYGRDVDERFLWTMSVVAHEVFHAAFSVYKEQSTPWRRYYAAQRTYFDQLADLSHNEGIAYYLSLIQRSRGKFQPSEVSNVQQAIGDFNNHAHELLSPTTPAQRSQRIIQESNTSGYWENYGSITGMIIARAIDNNLGRQALTETIADGPDDFFGKYIRLMKTVGDLPQLAPEVVRYFERRR
ncbi:MAG TPA: DUF5700 domain-containing putative Zn-dependent protease [Bacteroidota bacterium]